MNPHICIAPALAAVTALTSCGESNPFLGKWELSEGGNPLFCMRSLEVTEKMIRSPQGTGLYTLVRDGSNYIFDTKEPLKMVVTQGPNKSMLLEIGMHKCPFTRSK
jgi:hypothetical protein